MNTHSIKQMLLVVLVLLLALPAAAAEPINDSLDASPTGEVSITIVRGSVTVIAVEADKVSVEGTLDHESEAFIFERNGEVVQIEDKLKKRTTSGSGTEITVKVPSGSRVRAQLVSADLNVEGLAGPTRLSTVSGTIVASDLGAESEITSISGRITVSRATGEIRLQSVSGRIEASTSAAKVHAKSVSGRVEINNDQPLSSGRLSSLSGSLSLVTPVLPDVEIDMETISGRATLSLRGELNLRLNMIGGPGGNVRNNMNDSPVVDGGPGIGDRLETRFGEGKGYVRVSTVSGALTLEGS